MKKLDELKKYKKADLKLFRDQLEKEKEHLKELYQFSNGVEHSGTMDCKKEIKRLETIVEHLETAQEVPVQEQYIRNQIKAELKTFKKFQISINVLLFILIILLSVLLIKREIILNDLQTQLDILKQLLSRF